MKCAYRYCRKELKAKNGGPPRPSQRFCPGSECRTKEWDLLHPRTQRDKRSAPRRATRNGEGTRVYLTLNDFRDRGRIQRKLEAARERLENAHGSSQ